MGSIKRSYSGKEIHWFDAVRQFKVKPLPKIKPVKPCKGQLPLFPEPQPKRKDS